MNTKFFLILLLGTISLGGVLWWFFSSDKEGVEKEIRYTDSSYDTLTAQNPDFVSGENFIKERKAPEAIVSLERALEKATSPEEEAQIKYSMALAYSSTRKDTDDYKKSIALVKEIVKNPAYIGSVKALSIEVADRLLFSSVAKEAATVLAEDEPYKTFYKDGDLHSLRKNLLTYAESHYPLAGIEMKIAALHAKDLIELSKREGSTDTENSKIEFEKKFISETVSKGDADLNGRMKAIARLSVYTPEVLLYRALTADRFFQATKETPFGDPETLYKNAFETGEKYYRPQLPLIEYYYAVFLASLNKPERHQDVRNLLKPYNGPEASKAYMTGVFRKERENIIGEKKNIVLLSTVDSQFKEFLKKLGWNDTDFSQ